MTTVEIIALVVARICSVASRASSLTSSGKSEKGKLTQDVMLVTANERLHTLKVKVNSFACYEDLDSNAKNVVKSTFTTCRAIAKHAIKNNRPAFDAWTIGENIRVERFVKGETRIVALTPSVYNSMFMPKKDKTESAMLLLLKYMPKRADKIEAWTSFVADMEAVLSGNGNTGFAEAISKLIPVEK